MNKYIVMCLKDQYVIKADCWSVGVEGLKFYQWDRLAPSKIGQELERKIVAWFTTWDYWILGNEK